MGIKKNIQTFHITITVPRLVTWAHELIIVKRLMYYQVPNFMGSIETWSKYIIVRSKSFLVF